MLKKSSIRRIIITSTALLVFILIMLFPATNKAKPSFETTIEYVSVNKTPIFLIDAYDYVARTNIVIPQKETLEKIKHIIEALTINGQIKDYIPNGFKAIIPQNTKVLDLSIQDNLLKIDFSKEFLNVSLDDEEKLLESIIFSLTEINDIKSIMIFVEGKSLLELPNSKKRLSPVLDRNFGINKEIDIENFKNTSKTTVYYTSTHNDFKYYIPITKVSNDHSEKIEIIINALKSSPIHQTNLISYLASNTELLNYEILEESIHLSFNNYILNDFDEKNILEEVKYAIALSIRDNYNINETTYFIDDQEIINFILE